MRYLAVVIASVSLLGANRCPNPTPTPTPTPIPTPTPEPTPTPTPEPTPTPTPQPVACHPAPDDPRWGQPKPAVYTLYPEYQKAIQAVGDRCGFADGTEVPQRQTLDLIAAKWRELFPGRCVASPANWGGSGDTVSAKDPSGDFVEIHAVYFGNGCIIDGTNAFRAMWPCPGCVPGPEPTPTPTPGPTPTPPTDGCTDPVPAKVGRFNVQPYHRWYTTTPLFYGPGPDGYCVKVLGEQREFCPARSDCPGYKCEERQACERVGVGGLPLWRCSGQPPEVQENGYFARCGGDSTWIESCSTDGTVCTRRELQ